MSNWWDNDEVVTAAPGARSDLPLEPGDVNSPIPTSLVQEGRALVRDSASALETFGRTTPPSETAGDFWSGDEVVSRAAEPPAEPEGKTGVVEQTSSGLNEGIANALGLPVDMANNALGAIGLPELRNPKIAGHEVPIFGGSDFWKRQLDPVISDQAPETTVQRYARSAGQAVGAGAVMAPAMGVNTVAGLAANAAADLGSGVGSQVAEEVAPGNPYAEMAGGIVGGMLPIAGMRALRPSPQAPTRADLVADQKAAYDVVDNSGSRFSDVATDRLKQDLQATVDGMKIHQARHPKAWSMVEDLKGMKDPTIGELDQWRQVVSRDVASATDPSERALGQALKDRIDAFLDGVKPNDLVGGGDPTRTVGALKAGRAATSKIKKSDVIDTAIEKGERRAATSGVGGNTVNAIRQNIRSILDDPKKMRGFSDVERQAMEEAARGTSTTNALRLAGRFAPTGGALPMWGLVGQTAAAAASGNPLFALPAFIGEVAKVSGEKLTERQVTRLSAIVRNGGTIPPKTLLSVTEKRVLNALLAERAANGGTEQGLPQ